MADTYDVGDGNIALAAGWGKSSVKNELRVMSLTKLSIISAKWYSCEIIASNQSGDLPYMLLGPRHLLWIV